MCGGANHFGVSRKVGVTSRDDESGRRRAKPQRCSSHGATERLVQVPGNAYFHF
jgi:hypothetical protein